MWWSEHGIGRRAALFGAACVLAGCGFVPAYGTNGPASELIGQVEIVTPSTVEGYRLAERLRERLGTGSATAVYLLEVDLEIAETGVAVTQEGAVTRFTLVGVSKFHLIRKADGMVLASGEADNFTSYSTTDSTVATENARNDAAERLARILADQTVSQLQIELA